jgi:lipid-A-disaccharide synthase
MTIIGLDGIVKNVPLILRMFSVLKKKVEEIKPDIIVLVDYPGFNLRFATKVHNLNIPIVYYIAPQVWAWNYKRVKKIKKYIDKMLCILPFEEGIFIKEGINAKYVGNPIVDNAIPTFSDRDSFLSELKINNNKKIIGILPGSRFREIKEIMPVVVKAYDSIKDDYNFILGKAESVDEKLLSDYIKDRNIIITNKSYDLMKYSDLLWSCSGTVTLEAAYLKTPMILMYAVSRFTEMIFRLLINVEFAGLPNIIYGDKIIPELLQDDMNPKNLLEATNWIFENYDLVMEKIIQVSEKFTGLNPSENAAKEILNIFNERIN